MIDRKVIGRNIKAERVRAGMTQDETAKILEIDRATYNKFENGNKMDSIYIYKLSKIFNCSIDNFYMGLETTKSGK